MKVEVSYIKLLLTLWRLCEGILGTGQKYFITAFFWDVSDFPHLSTTWDFLVVFKPSSLPF